MFKQFFSVDSNHLNLFSLVEILKYLVEVWKESRICWVCLKKR